MPDRNHDIERLFPVQWVEVHTRFNTGFGNMATSPRGQGFDPGRYPVRTDWNDGLVVGDPRRSQHISWADIDRYGRLLDENEETCGSPVGACRRCRGTVYGCTPDRCSRIVGTAREPRVPSLEAAEQHSADWTSYIEHVGPQRWDVIFDGKYLSSMPTREQARIDIRGAKVVKAAHELGHFAVLPKAKFDAICAKLSLDPEDDALVDRLVSLGWQFNHVDDEYISPDKPEGPVGRWRHLLEWLDEP